MSGIYKVVLEPWLLGSNGKEDGRESIRSRGKPASCRAAPCRDNDQQDQQCRETRDSLLKLSMYVAKPRHLQRVEPCAGIVNGVSCDIVSPDSKGGIELKRLVSGAYLPQSLCIFEDTGLLAGRRGKWSDVSKSILLECPAGMVWRLASAWRVNAWKFSRKWSPKSKDNDAPGFPA